MEIDSSWKEAINRFFFNFYFLFFIAFGFASKLAKRPRFEPFKHFCNASIIRLIAATDGFSLHFRFKNLQRFCLFTLDSPHTTWTHLGSVSRWPTTPSLLQIHPQPHSFTSHAHTSYVYVWMQINWCKWENCARWSHPSSQSLSIDFGFDFDFGNGYGCLAEL